MAASVEVEWYFDSERTETGWKGEAVGLREEDVVVVEGSTPPFAWGAMMMMVDWEL